MNLIDFRGESPFYHSRVGIYILTPRVYSHRNTDQWEWGRFTELSTLKVESFTYDEYRGFQHEPN
jgi:hypothetical protein